MLRTLNKMTDFTNVVPGGKATIDLPVRDRYHGVFLKVSQDDGISRANIIAAIGAIKVKLNGRDQWDVTAAQMFALNDQRGYPAIDGFIPLYFSNPKARTFQEEIQTAWDVKGQTSFQIEVEIKAGIVNPTIEAYAQTVAGGAGLGMIRKISQVRIPNVNAGASAITLDSLPLHGGVQALHFFETAANDVERVSLKLAKRELYVADRAVMDFMNGQDGFAPVTGVATIRFDGTRKVLDAMPLVDANDKRQFEFRLDIDMANANALTLVREYIGPAN